VLILRRSHGEHRNGGHPHDLLRDTSKQRARQATTTMRAHHDQIDPGLLCHRDFLTKPVSPAELVVRVRSALELRRVKASLDEHVQLLKRQRDDLLRLQLQKERLTMFVVHDLKNPVNTIDLHAQSLLRGDGLTATARESVTWIRRSTRRLDTMILNLLDISKADAGQLVARASDVALRGVVDEVVSELSADATERSVSIRSSLATDRIRVDANLFRRTLFNLVENAIRYAPPGSSVTVAAAAGDAATEVRVSDAGKGIPAGMRESVFRPFVQVESGKSVATNGNRGLGLAFCKLATEVHRGRIWVEDGAPGAVFCMSFPHEP
jgi:two-component system sensor histidine kinase/response regulator